MTPPIPIVYVFFLSEVLSGGVQPPNKRESIVRRAPLLGGEFRLLLHQSASSTCILSSTHLNITLLEAST